MKYLMILVLCFGLAGCIGGRSQPAQFYTLTPMVNDVVTKKSLSIGVRRAMVARYLDRPQIVTQERDANEMRVSEDNRWIEPLSELVARVLAQDLAVALPRATVKPDLFGLESCGYQLNVEVVRMDATLGETATLTAFWALKDTTRAVVLQDKMTATVPVGKSYDDLAKAQSDLLADLARQIAKKISTL